MIALNFTPATPAEKQLVDALRQPPPTTTSYAPTLRYQRRLMDAESIIRSIPIAIRNRGVSRCCVLAVQDAIDATCARLS